MSGVCPECGNWTRNHNPDCEVWLEMLTKVPHHPFCWHLWRDRIRHRADYQPEYLDERKLCQPCLDGWYDKLREFYAQQETS